MIESENGVMMGGGRGMRRMWMARVKERPHIVQIAPSSSRKINAEGLGEPGGEHCKRKRMKPDPSVSFLEKTSDSDHSRINEQRV